MSITKRIRGILQSVIIAALVLAVPFPSFFGIPAVMEVQAADYYSYFYYDDEEEEEEDVWLNYDGLWMNAGKTRKLKVHGATGKIKWSSSNKKVAKVSSKGVVTAKAAGTATITIKCKNPKKTLKCKVRVFTPASVKKKLLKLKKKYPEGKHWTNESASYYWEAAGMYGYGCYALVGLFSDKVFGKDAPIKRYTSYKKIKAGDHIRIGESHSVVVLEKKGNKLTVVEGNYNSSVHWKRVITKSQLQSEGFWVETRYW